MSQENVEIVRAVFRGWDEAGVEGMLPLFHEDVEYLPYEEAKMESWQVWLVREGKVVRWEEYLDRAEALEAVGLAE